MQTNQLTILGVHVSHLSRSESLLKVSNYLKSKSNTPLTIFTPNPEQVVAAQENEDFRALLNTADIALPDGIGLTWATRVRSSQFTVLRSRTFSPIPGIDFMEDLCKLAAKEGYPVALIGGRGNTSLRALKKLKQKYPELTGWAEEPEELTVRSSQSAALDSSRDESSANYTLTANSSHLKDIYFDQLATRIKETGIKLIFVGLGAPKQEYFIKQLSEQVAVGSGQKSQIEPLQTADYKLPTMVMMSVGGAFDEISGKIPRTPKLISNLGLKWLWRLMLEPWRIRRQTKLLKFVYQVLTSSNK